MSHQVACVVGTRPEVVKMAPLVARLREVGPGVKVRVVSTGQHRGLLDRALADFGIAADLDLGLMRGGQGLADLTARALVALAGAFEADRPDLVLAQGDTTSVMATALACHYNRIPFGHVEAGLRTGRRYLPFPEEMNRALTSRMAEVHFAPTAEARANLLREGIDPGSIHVTGNTVIDALLLMAGRATPLPVRPTTERFLLVTAHRRENWGGPLRRVCEALRSVVARNPDLSLVFPVHPNPEVRRVADECLGGLDRVHLIGPVGYPEFVALMKASYLIVTDSGGVQEEAPSLGKPVLVLRGETERPEAVEAGTALLVGTDGGAILASVERLLGDPEAYRTFARTVNPYGDGRASGRIVEVLRRRFGLGAADPAVPEA